MEVSSEEKPRNLWKYVDQNKHQVHVTISPIDSTAESDDMVVYMNDLEKRREVYGICGECNEPGTGSRWCQPCNAKRFKENFKNWTSGNKDIDELIQHSQLNAVHRTKFLEWIPYENFKDIDYITKGGFGRIFSAKWTEGYIEYWDIDNQEWKKWPNTVVALKSLNDASELSKDFLNEIKSHLQIYIYDVIQCYGITQFPDTKNYGMVLAYCLRGSLRDYLKENMHEGFESKIETLSSIARGLQDIHNSGKVHKDFHSGNILFNKSFAYIGDLGMCQPANNKKSGGVFGVLPYMAPEVLRGLQYTKKADIYSFGIIMNEYLSEETPPYNDIPHDHVLAVKICKGLRPKITDDTPKLLADLIKKCWDAKSENRPTSRELYQILKKWKDELNKRYGDTATIEDSEIYSQIKECEKIRENKSKTSRSDKDKSKNTQIHPNAIYTSRLLNFKNLPDPTNSTDLSFTSSVASQSISTMPFSDFLDFKVDDDSVNQEEGDDDK